MTTPTPVVFGTLGDTPVYVHTLTDAASGAVLRVSEFGASIVSFEVVGRDGLLDHVVLGYNHLAAYTEGGPAHRWHFGNTVGRNANRIAASGFDLEGKHYDLELNNAPAGQPCHLHGGSKGFGKQLWRTTAVSETSITLEYVSPDGDQNYPGEVTLAVTYTVSSAPIPSAESNAGANANARSVALEIKYSGTTTATTILNPTNHAYWNLSGHRRSSAVDAASKALVPVTEHLLWLPKTTVFTPTNAGLITTGELLPVKGSCFDFATGPRVIVDALETTETGGEAYATQRTNGNGVDHNFCVDGYDGTLLRHAARLSDPKRSGLVMDILTTAPAIQVYTGNFLTVLPDAPSGHEGVAYDYRTAACLETQYYPNAINVPAWPQPVTKAGERFTSTTLHRITIQQQE